MEQANDKSLRAMILLLEDPDEHVFKEIRGQLLSMGNEVIPALENIWESTFNNTLQSRIEDIIQKIQFNSTSEELKLWAATGGID